MLGSRAVEPVWGYDGGEAAMGSGLIHGDEELGVMRSGVTARRDTLIRFWEGGGGGWGDRAHGGRPSGCGRTSSTAT